MQTKTQSIINSLVVLFIIIALPQITYAQPGDPGGDPAPIDGGVSIVAAACAGYLAKRKMQKKKIEK